MDPSTIVEILQELGPVIGVLAVVLGTVIAGWFQSRVARQQVEASHRSQLEVLQESHKQSLEIMSLQQRREEDLRISQYEESDRADRLLVMEYVDLLIPRLYDVVTIRYLAKDNKDAEELKRYLRLQGFMASSSIDPAHPEKNLGLRITFLMLQLIAAMRLALNARWTRPLTEDQRRFLAHWEADLEPIFCSGRYPGKELLYREQIEIVSEEMLARVAATGIIRPINWRVFCRKYTEDEVTKEITETIRSKLQFIFQEDKSLPPRKAMQCRLAMMSLYLIRMSEESDNDIWSWMNQRLWTEVVEWFQWERNAGQSPKWFVFEYGDVTSRVPAEK